MKKSYHKIQSVYRNQNALVRAVFERAGDNRKVLCIALDYAKRKHVVLICDCNGDVLKNSFPVENNAASIAHLIKEISATARRRKIPKDQIFLGGEDEADYVANFTAALRGKGYLVVRVNAYEAKEHRENLLTSTDTLDLLGIAKTLLSRRARLTGETATADPASHHLRELTRCRRGLVRQRTAASNRIHALADQLFPGFLNGSKSALTPFSKASLELMLERFSCPEIARRKPASLANTLRRNGVQQADETAAKIILLAREALPPAAPVTWTVLQRKWCAVSGGLDLILDEAHPLGFWRKVMLELHGIDLPPRL